MGANDNPRTTRSIVTDYFDWRLNNKTIIPNTRLFIIICKIATDCEANFNSDQQTFNFHISSSVIDLRLLSNIHKAIAKEIFDDGKITWSRIITFISFSAMLAERLIQQNILSTDLIISSVVNWTTNFIDTNLHTWLESQNYWAGCLKFYDRAPQRRNSISRYASILGTIGMLTLGALYIRRA